MATTLLTWDGTDENGQPLLWSDSLSWDGSLPQPESTIMPNLRVLLDFTRTSDHALEERATNVHTKLYLATVLYPDPPVTAVALQAAITTFTLAIAATEQGGKQATANKNEAKTALIELLRELAIYVQASHNNNLATLMDSGFDAASTNRASTPLSTPNISKINLPSKGAAKLIVPAVRNARNYSARFALVDAEDNPGPWTQQDNFLSTRSLIITGLVSGGLYSFQVRANGGSTRESDWSNTVTARCL